MVPSKRSVLLVVACACLVALPALGQPYEKFTDVPANAPVAPPATAGAPAAPQGGLVFYSDRGAFTSDFPGLTSEDFTGTSLGPDAVQACTAPMNSSSNDACFSPGAIVDGLSVDVQVTTGSGEGVAATPSFLGLTSVAVGPNSFDDNMVIDLSSASAFGLDIVCPLGATTMGVEIFGAGGSLGTTTTPCGGPPGTFWGVSAGENIDQIIFSTGGSDAELGQNMLFGGAPVPTAKMPVLAVMFLVLLSGSAFLIWRR